MALKFLWGRGSVGSVGGSAFGLGEEAARAALGAELSRVTSLPFHP